MNPSSVTEKLEALDLEVKAMKVRLAASQLRCRVLSGFALAVVIGGVLLLQAQPAVAQGHGGGNTTDSRLTSLETRMTAAEAVNTTQTGQISALQTTDGTQNSNISQLQAVTYQQHGDILDLQDRTRYISIDGHEMYITEANLHIVNGTGFTFTTNGLGNLIVGYNEERISGLVEREGSHNIVCGVGNNYSSYGGMVIGLNNSVTDQYASVSGGFNNIASGQRSSISGGSNNVASGGASSISGGNSITQGADTGWSAGSNGSFTESANFRSP